jgi:hypothetical protein
MLGPMIDVRLALVLALAACQPPPPPVAPAQPATSCAQLTDAVRSALSGTPADFAATLADVATRRCEMDRWSEAMRQCIVASRSDDDLHACKTQRLSPPQQQALEHDSVAALEALRARSAQDFREQEDLEAPEQYKRGDADGAIMPAGGAPRPAHAVAPAAPPPPPPPAPMPRSPSREADPCAGGR